MEPSPSSEIGRVFYPVSLPIARLFSLSHLPAHFPTLLLAFVCFQLLEWFSPIFLARISSTHFGRADSRTRHNMVVRIVSMVHALIIIPLALFSLDIPELDQDRAFGFDVRVGHIHAIACGFIWDTLESIFHSASIGFIIHGATCLVVFSLSFRPFLGYYGVRFLLWELTPFLNIHWFLDKTNRTGSLLQTINGVMLLTTFFLARLCYGGWMSVRFFYTLKETRAEIPTVVAVAFLLGNLALQGLNWFWFYSMLQKWPHRKTSRPTHRVPSGLNGAARANGKKDR